MQTLDNKVVVVTGAASGIGRALAETLSKHGAHLALSDVNSVGLEETAQRARRPDRKLTTRRVDVSDAKELQDFAEAVKAEHGGAHVLINNAGVALYGRFDEVEMNDFEWLMSINFWGVVHGVRAFLPQLLAQSEAHVVNLSSAFGLVAPVEQTAYSASKFAVRGFSESLRHEYRGTPLRVTVVHPGGIRTNIANSARLPKAVDVGMAKQRLERFNMSLRMPPEAAAERIVRAVLRNEDRLLIGVDAMLLDQLARWLPASYWRVLEPMLGAAGLRRPE
jgi:NAD(P)-dependent dehydrogenase (short-subunit alcohol dehydrogenase family)